MGRYAPWEAFFAGIDDDDVVVSVARLQEILGYPQPPSALRHPAWWAGAQPHAVWTRSGFRASPNLASATVRFRRRATGLQPTRQAAVGSPDDGRRLIILGCVAEKLSHPAPARDLYVSPLWEKRRRYAEASGMPWVILSAEYGLVLPEQVIAPYDRALALAPPAERRGWAAAVCPQVVDHCRHLGIALVEVHAGAAYVENGLIEGLNAAGIRVLWPLRGKRIGEQSSWYDDRAMVGAVTTIALRPAADPESPPVVAPDMADLAAEPPRILSLHHISAFDYRWPDATEFFDYGWEGRCATPRGESSFRHGVGSREVYGRVRVHTVTWIDGAPVVEGVAADDYPVTRALMSLVKLPDGSMARTPADVPGGYGEFRVVDHSAEIQAPYTRRGMAVKIRVDDVAGWLHHAVLRGRRGDGAGGAGTGTAAGDSPGGPGDPTPRHGLAPTAPDVLPVERKQLIAERLVAIASSEAVRNLASAEPEFTGDPEADALVIRDPFAFLVAVICDQGILAERAWRTPLELVRRLGHLDPERLLADPDAAYQAFRQPPALHRYVENVPGWILAAARTVLEEYEGDAGAIWNDRPAAGELQARLRRFPGIGQKKAAMAVEILERNLGVEIQRMSESDIAYDVHIRRVFLRTGLAEWDRPEHMISVARAAYPERPGAMDLPAWVVGRTWCRPSAPDCPACPVREVCAQRVAAGDRVSGI